MNPAQRQQRLGAVIERGYARAEAFAAQHGITDLKTAVDLLAQSDATDLAIREVLAFAQQLTPQHVQHLGKLEASYGPAAVFNALISAGLSSAGLEVVTAAYNQAGNLAGVVQMVTADLQAEAQAGQQAAIEAHIAHAQTQDADGQPLAQIKRDSPLIAMASDPGVHRVAAAICARIGLAVTPGQSPFAALLPYLRGMEGGDWMNGDNGAGRPFDKKWTPEEAIAEVAKAFGSDPRDVAELLQEVEAADYGHEFATRLASRDKPMIEMSREGVRRERIEGHRRGVLESKFDELDQPAAARSAPERSTQERPQFASPTGRRAALEHAFDEIEAGDEADAHETTDQSSGRRAALSDAYDELSDDEEEAA
jgi:hypothetical protein